MEVKLCGYNMLAPAYNSFGGKLLESIEAPQTKFADLPLIKKISLIGQRILLLFAYLGATVLDFVILLAMTITIIPALRVGRAHLINLICSLASLILGFGILFGHNQPVDKARQLLRKPVSTVQEEEVQTAVRVEQNFEHLLSKMTRKSILEMSIEDFYKVSDSIEKLVAAGVDINGVVKRYPDDIREYRLIHFLTQEMSRDSWGFGVLIETAIRLGADPYIPVGEGWNGANQINLIDKAIPKRNSPYREADLQFLRMLGKRGIKFDRPFEVFGFHCASEERFLNDDAFSKNILLYAAYLSYPEAIALLIEGGASLNFNESEQKALTDLKSNCVGAMQVGHDRGYNPARTGAERLLNNVRLIRSLQTGASVEERRWAASMLLSYDCFNTAMKLLNQHDIAPSSEDERIDWSSAWLVAAIDSGNINSVNFILGKYALTWNDAGGERIAQLNPFEPAKSPDHAAGFEMINAINQYKAKVLETIYTMPSFSNLRKPVEHIIAKQLF